MKHAKRMFKRCGLGAAAGRGWQTAGLDAHKKPLMCGLGVPVGCRMKHAKRMFKRCGLGAALLPARFGVQRSSATVCRVLRVLRVLRVFKRFKGFRGFKGLRAGKRQAWTPTRSH